MEVPPVPIGLCRFPHEQLAWLDCGSGASACIYLCAVPNHGRLVLPGRDVCLVGLQPGVLQSGDGGLFPPRKLGLYQPGKSDAYRPGLSEPSARLRLSLRTPRRKRLPTQKINNNIAIWKADTTSPMARSIRLHQQPYNPNSEKSKWCWGHDSVGTGPTWTGSPAVSPLGDLNYGDPTLCNAAWTSGSGRVVSSPGKSTSTTRSGVM